MATTIPIPISTLNPNYPSPPLPSPHHHHHRRRRHHIHHLLRLSAQTRNLTLTKSLHTLLTKTPHLHSDTLLSNSLISAYLALDRLSHARHVFDQIPHPDAASFSSLISAYSKHPHPPLQPNALLLFRQMRLLGVPPNSFTFVALLTYCIRRRNLRLGSQLHALSVKFGCSCGSLYVGNALVGMYVGCGVLDDAVKVFDGMPERDVSSWNALVSGMVRGWRYEEAFELFRGMRGDGWVGDGFSISTLLSAAGEGFSLGVGEAVHGHAIKAGLDLGTSVGNALVRFYSQFGGIEDVVNVFEKMLDKDVISWTGMLTGFMEFGFLESAVEIFDKMPERNTVSYNALLVGFCRNGEGLRGLQFFQRMVKDGMEISDFTLTSAANACALVANRKNSEQIHGFIIKVGCGSNAWIEAALLDMCARCGRMEDAEKIYNLKIQKGKSFPITWNSLINARARNGQPEEALSLFHSGLKRDDLMAIIDEVTLATVLGICGTLGFVTMGEQIHSFALKSNAISDTAVGNAVFTMYAKCGNLDAAISFFNQMPYHNLVSYNALINAYLLHRKGEKAFGVWLDMKKSSEKPDNITFLLLISACRYFPSSNSIETCQQIFSLMTSSYGIRPSSEHYAAMVDVLSYWGNFDEAKKLIESMPFKPGALVWRTLLDNCRLRSNLSLGRQAVQRLLTLEPKDESSYIFISNLYSASGRWHCSDKVRDEMRAKGLKKNPARSWVVHQNEVHSFYGRDGSHPMSKDIHSGLEVLILECMKAGYTPDTGFVLQEAEEYQKKHFLYYHSAKLAVTYGLIVAGPREVVRVVKSVRLCGDCHEFLKVVSGVTRRRIVVRDGSGFHSFEGGKCICGDSR